MASTSITATSIARTGRCSRAHLPDVRIPPAPGANVRVLRRDRLGGLIREYAQFAKGDRVFGTHKVSLPDIGNGYFIHPADRVARQAADGEPRRIGPPHELDVLVFGSDGGGALYAVPAAKPGPVYRLRECSIKDGIAIAGDIKVVAVDYRTFLQRLEIAVETFAATGHPADL